MTILSRLVSHNLLAGMILTIVVQPSLASDSLSEGVSLDAQVITAAESTVAQTSADDTPAAEETGSEDAAASEETEADTLRIVVTATRTEEEITNVPRSVRVVDREDLQQQLVLSNNLIDALGKLVPGFSPPPLQSATRGFTLRGRNALVLIDGVPQNANGPGVDAFDTIAPDSIERVEVVPGASAIYGDGATGGIVNIITRAPAEGDITYEADFGVIASLTNLDNDGSFSYTGGLGVAAAEEEGDVRLSINYDIENARFDADGNRIIPIGGINDADRLGILAKIGYNIDDDQRVGVTYNFFKNEITTEFTTDPAVTAEPGTQVARSLFLGDFDYDEPPETINHNLNLTYRHADVFGSQLDAQLYLKDIEQAVRFNDLRSNNRRPDFFPDIFQNLTDISEIGARVQVDTPLGESASLLWGVDYSEEENEVEAAFLDPVAFDANQELNIIDQFSLFPPYKIDKLGLFAQARWDISDQFQISGGLRYSDISFSVDDYQLAFRDPRERQGGSGSDDDVSFNAGLLYRPIPEVGLFANFSQGFSLPNLGTAFSQARPGFNIDNDLLFQPQSVDNFELGARAEFDTIQASLAGFYSESNLGASLRFDAETGFTEVVRAPQRNYGVEATLDWQPSDVWRFGGNVTWSEGENDADDDGNFDALSALNVPPYKLGLYVENQTTPRWSNRLQLLLVGDRDRAFEDGVDPFDIDSYVTLDLVSSLQLGPGRLVLGIENLLNDDYINAVTQERVGRRDDRRFASPGTTMSVRYNLEF
ncbi:MAG: TonB-dependent receptor [Cyanobacteria bacterium P01_B01_bin.77]